MKKNLLLVLVLSIAIPFFSLGCDDLEEEEIKPITVDIYVSDIVTDPNDATKTKNVNTRIIRCHKFTLSSVLNKNTNQEFFDLDLDDFEDLEDDDIPASVMQNRLEINFDKTSALSLTVDTNGDRIGARVSGKLATSLIDKNQFPIDGIFLGGPTTYSDISFDIKITADLSTAGDSVVVSFEGTVNKGTKPYAVSSTFALPYVDLGDIIDD